MVDFITNLETGLNKSQQSEAKATPAATVQTTPVSQSGGGVTTAQQAQQQVVVTSIAGLFNPEQQRLKAESDRAKAATGQVETSAANLGTVTQAVLTQNIKQAEAEKQKASMSRDATIADLQQQKELVTSQNVFLSALSQKTQALLTSAEKHSQLSDRYANNANGRNADGSEMGFMGKLGALLGNAGLRQASERESTQAGALISQANALTAQASTVLSQTNTLAAQKNAAEIDLAINNERIGKALDSVDVETGLVKADLAVLAGQYNIDRDKLGAIMSGSWAAANGDMDTAIRMVNVKLAMEQGSVLNAQWGERQARKDRWLAQYRDAERLGGITPIRDPQTASENAADGKLDLVAAQMGDQFVPFMHFTMGNNPVTNPDVAFSDILKQGDKGASPANKELTAQVSMLRGTKAFAAKRAEIEKTYMKADAKGQQVAEMLTPSQQVERDREIDAKAIDALDTKAAATELADKYPKGVAAVDVRAKLEELRVPEAEATTAKVMKYVSPRLVSAQVKRTDEVLDAYADTLRSMINSGDFKREEAEYYASEVIAPILDQQLAQAKKATSGAVQAYGKLPTNFDNDNSFDYTFDLFASWLPGATELKGFNFSDRNKTRQLFNTLFVTQKAGERTRILD